MLISLRFYSEKHKNFKEKPSLVDGFSFCVCVRMDWASFASLLATSFLAEREHRSAKADTKQSCLTANSAQLRTNDVGLRPTMLHFLQTKSREFHGFVIIPQAILSPAFPEGCVLKSSGILWIITVFPIISERVKRSVKT